MEYRVEKGEKSTVKVYITLSDKEWQAAQEDAYNKTKGKYALQGFRKGKVPMKVLENAYGKGIFFEDAINGCFPKYYVEVLSKETSIEDVAQPDIDIEKVGEDGITIIAIVPVKPEVKLGEYKGITFKKNVYNVEKADVDKEIERLIESRSRLVDVTGRAAIEGDTAVIDYSGSVDGVKFEGGTAENYSLKLGSHTFIPGFEEQVIGMNIGEEKDINVKFPEEYHAENLKGKDAVFKVKVNGLKAKELPTLDDEFIKDAVGSESVESYKAETEKKLQEENDKKAERELEDAIVKSVSESSTMEIPDALIENQISNMVREMEYRMSYQGLKLEDYLKYTAQTMENFREGYRAQAEELVKSQLVLQKIVEVENLDATENELEARIAEMATEQNKSVDEMKKLINDEYMSYIKNQISVKKLFDFLKANNVIE